MARNLEHYKYYGMPRLEKVEKRFPHLSDSEKLCQLTFVCCIGLQMNGEYVDYVGLKDLSEEMPLSQAMLQRG